MNDNAHNSKLVLQTLASIIGVIGAASQYRSKIKARQELYKIRTHEAIVLRAVPTLTYVCLLLLNEVDYLLKSIDFNANGDLNFITQICARLKPILKLDLVEMLPQLSSLKLEYKNDLAHRPSLCQTMATLISCLLAIAESS